MAYSASKSRMVLIKNYPPTKELESATGKRKPFGDSRSRDALISTGEQTPTRDAPEHDARRTVDSWSPYQNRTGFVEINFNI